MIVSIIIPIYNVEKYIVRCIDSVLNQTYRNIEVILVDDCTPDRSMDMAREYIEQSLLSEDLDFVYLKHDHNRGLSAARNTGMYAATGDYVYFLDSDDKITEDCIGVLTKPLEQEIYDFVIGDYTMIGEYNYFQPLRVEGEMYGSDFIAKSYLKREWYPMAWNKLCRLEYLKKNDMYFQEGLIHEDELWSYQLACTAKSMYAVKTPTYSYCIRPGSISTANDAYKKKRRVENFIKVLEGMYKYQMKHMLKNPVVYTLQNTFKIHTFNIALIAGYTMRDAYINLGRADVRSIMMKYRMFSSFKELLLNIDIFLPPNIGFFYRSVLRSYFVRRTHDNNYPFWF